MKVSLNSKLCYQLREKINEYKNYSITKTHSLKKDKNGKAWNKICAIMDRLDDTVDYLDSIDITPKNSLLSIFDFYNFINHSATLIDCISLLAEIYDVDLSNENASSGIFCKEGPDKLYFEYLRSLCSVHPIETSRHKIFQDSETCVECSPFATWNKGFVSDNSEIVIIVYTDGKEHSSRYIGIQLKILFSYVTSRFNLLIKIIDNIDSYYKNIILDFQMQQLKTYKDFSSYLNYIEYLKSIYNERVDSGYNEYFDFYENVFKIKFRKRKNIAQLKKYQNVIKYGISFLHNYLQLLPESDLFETTGLKTQPPHTIGDSLFFQLQDCEAGDYRYSHMYAFEKLSLMWLQPQNMLMINGLLDDVKDFWNNYLEFEENMTATEVSVFIHLASYFWRLDNDTWFNENIPIDLKYR